MNEEGGRVVPLIFTRNHLSAMDVVQFDGARWILSIDDLYETFARSIRRYQRMLLKNEALRDQFEREFTRYGELQFRWFDDNVLRIAGAERAE
jgi:hypothetical protein